MMFFLSVKVSTWLSATAINSDSVGMYLCFHFKFIWYLVCISSSRRSLLCVTVHFLTVLFFICFNCQFTADHIIAPLHLWFYVHILCPFVSAVQLDGWQLLVACWSLLCDHGTGCQSALWDLRDRRWTWTMYSLGPKQVCTVCSLACLHWCIIFGCCCFPVMHIVWIPWGKSNFGFMTGHDNCNQSNGHNIQSVFCAQGRQGITPSQTIPFGTVTATHWFMSLWSVTCPHDLLQLYLSWMPYFFEVRF